MFERFLRGQRLLQQRMHRGVHGVQFDWFAWNLLSSHKWSGYSVSCGLQRHNEYVYERAMWSLQWRRRAMRPRQRVPQRKHLFGRYSLCHRLFGVTTMCYRFLLRWHHVPIGGHVRSFARVQFELLL